MVAKGLGKGLSALISEETLTSVGSGYIPDVPIDDIIPNRYQPRTHVDEDKLNELVASINEHGIIEPLIVTQSKKSSKYELIAGERRLRAAKKAGLQHVPVVIKEASPQQMLELAVVENIQRADLNPLEEGMAFEQLVSEFNMTHADISDKVGLSRPAIANKMRLLKLPDAVKNALLNMEIDEGHARALLGLQNDATILQAYRMIIRDKMSVRGVEELVRRLNQGHKKPIRRHHRLLDTKTQEIETKLKSLYSDKISLSRSQRGGKIVIPFTSDKELDDIYSKLTKK